MRRFLGALATLGFAFASAAYAHEVRPAYLELRETAPDTYDVLWKVPARGGSERLAIYVHLPADMETLAEPRGIRVGGAFVERWRVRRPGGLAGQTIHVDGLAAADVDVLIRLERSDGSTQTALLRPGQRSFVVEAATSTWGVASAYLVLGVEHILGGVDHLLFVLALLLVVKGWKRLFWTITAFTVAHSIALAAATLGFVHVWGPPVEACIALSIVLVAVEIIRSRTGRSGLMERAPWLIALTFGLLHGLGFAGALSEIGLPQNAIPLALLFFNVGVELGQFLFIASVVLVALLARRVARRVDLPHPAWAWRLPPYAIGSVAAFWLIQRIAAF